jgi:hypothetical protein
MRTCAVVLLIGIAPTASAKLELRDIQAAHGQLGPERQGAEYVSGDQVFFRYTIAGIRTHADGRMRAEMRLTVNDTKGNTLLKRETPLQQVVALGGDSVPAFASFDLTEDVPPGEYEFLVEIADLLSKESASFRRKFTCKKEEFALVQIRFHLDERGESAAPPGGIVSQTLFLKMKAVGFDRSKGEIDVEMAIHVLDRGGKPVMPRPIRASVHAEKPEEVKQINRLALSGVLTLNRTGDFVLRITLTDKMAKKEVSFETPIVVTGR